MRGINIVRVRINRNVNVPIVVQDCNAAHWEGDLAHPAPRAALRSTRVRNGAAAPCMRPVQMRLLGSINLFHTLDRTYAGPEGDRGRVCGPCV